MTFNPISVDFQYQCKMGFWSIDSESKQIILSEYLTDTLNLRVNRICYADFLKMLAVNIRPLFVEYFKNEKDYTYIDTVISVFCDNNEFVLRILKNQDVNATVICGTAHLLNKEVKTRYRQFGDSTYNSKLLLSKLYEHNDKTISHLVNSLCSFNQIGILVYNITYNEHYSNSQWRINNNIEQLDWSQGIQQKFKSLHPEDSSELHSLMDKLYTGVISNFTYEYRIVTGNYDPRSYKWIRSHFYSDILDNNEHIIIEFNIDITHLKDHDDQLARIEKKAMEVDKMKSHFIANISHEIRTPLNVIIGLSDVICDTETQRERDEYLRLIKKSNQQLLGLVDDIIRVSQIETEQFRVHSSYFNLVSLIEEIINRVSMRVPEDIKFQFNPSDKDCVIYQDKDKLSTILVNLITNATKFTEKGSITLKYKLFNNSLRISVDDTGIGMTHDQMQVIFNRFVKLNGFSPGSGLGLYICKQLVRKMGGDIGVRSTIGVGSTFWFRIPLIPAVATVV
ncbi:MAG: ATP-binding protein [Marinifilaceae bacterium]